MSLALNSHRTKTKRFMLVYNTHTASKYAQAKKKRIKKGSGRGWGWDRKKVRQPEREKLDIKQWYWIIQNITRKYF